MNASAAGNQALTLGNGSTTGVLFLMGAQDAASPGGQSWNAPPQGRDEAKRVASDDEQPPAKRPRVSSSRPSSVTSSQARRDMLRTRLRAQLLPHIIRAVGELPAAELRLDAIAIQVCCTPKRHSRLSFEIFIELTFFLRLRRYWLKNPSFALRLLMTVACLPLLLISQQQSEL